MREFRTDYYGTYDKEVRRNIQYNFRSRGLYMGLLSGDHQWGKPVPRSWPGASVTRTPPNSNRTCAGLTWYGRIVSDSTTGNGQEPGYYRLFFGGPRLNLLNSRFYSTLRENGYTASADAE